MNKTYFIDLDGTMYLGSKPMEGAIEFINYLIKNKIPFLFLTNNATRTQSQACEHMLKMGFKNLEAKHFYTSAMAAADKIAKDYPATKDVYYIGESGMKEALIAKDFHINPDQADFLFIGLDRLASYKDYSYAIRLVKKGARLVGTNNDRILLNEAGPNIGNGAIVAMFEYASNTEAIKIGKPHVAIIEGALSYMNIHKENVTLIGDNLETDIQCGCNFGIETIFVAGGVHRFEDCHTLNIHPTYLINNLKGLIN